MSRTCLSLIGLLLFPLWAGAGPGVSPTAGHQDALMMGRTFSAVPQPDGLISVGFGLRTLTSPYKLGGQLERISVKDLLLLMEADLFPWLTISAEVPRHSWSGGKSWLEPTGTGVGDGTWQAASGHNLVGNWLYGALGFGGNLPVGDAGQGMGEGVFSPRASVAMTLRMWSQNQVPEMRLHFNYSHIWNQAEERGYGTGENGLQPWPGKYPSGPAAGGHVGNDQTQWGVAVEFRNAATSLWLEFVRDRFVDNPFVSDQEQISTVSAGLRWGLEEGWALHGKYLVSLAEDDEATDWFPNFPEWSMSVAVTRQFSIGGRDQDHDGIPDRKDECPTVAEDLDGFQDEDGCPDYDNDQDGIPDVIDKAPLLPEDYDGFQDQDGAPDYDNDGDGIADKDDVCPDEPEDYDGHFDNDGCPDDYLDTDGDGVEDRNDQCPEQAEDRDGFEDDDGCPDPDNDLDGIPDSVDGCPDEPENYNGIDDTDGCPD